MKKIGRIGEGVNKPRRIFRKECQLIWHRSSYFEQPSFCAPLPNLPMSATWRVFCDHNLWYRSENDEERVENRRAEPHHQGTNGRMLEATTGWVCEMKRVFGFA